MVIVVAMERMDSLNRLGSVCASTRICVVVTVMSHDIAVIGVWFRLELN